MSAIRALALTHDISLRHFASLPGLLSAEAV
jgi:hypothetical protein